MKFSSPSLILYFALLFYTGHVFSQQSTEDTESQEIYGELIELEEGDNQDGEFQEEVFVVPLSQSENSILDEMDRLDAEAAAAAAEEEAILGIPPTLQEESPANKETTTESVLKRAAVTKRRANTSDKVVKSESTVVDEDEELLSGLEELEDSDIEESTEPVSSDTVSSSEIASDGKTNLTMTTNVSQITGEEKSPWSFILNVGSSANMAKVHDQTATIGNYYSLTFGYTLDNGLMLSATPVFLIDYSIERGSAQHRVGNANLGANLAKLFVFSGNTVGVGGKIYLPTSYEARAAGLNSVFRGDASISREFTPKFSGSYRISPRYYWQSNRTSANFDEFGRLEENPKANTGLRLENELAASYKINEILSIGGTVGIDYFFNYDDPNLGNDGANKTTFDWSTGASLFPMKNLKVSVAISQSHDIEDGSGFSLLNTEESKYSGTVSASF